MSLWWNEIHCVIPNHVSKHIRTKYNGIGTLCTHFRSGNAYLRSECAARFINWPDSLYLDFSKNSQIDFGMHRSHEFAHVFIHKHIMTWYKHVERATNAEHSQYYIYGLWSYHPQLLFCWHFIYGPRQAKKCPPAIWSLFIQSIVSNDSISGQRRPRSDCANAQTDHGFRCSYMPEDTFPPTNDTTGRANKLERTDTTLQINERENN